MQLMVFGDYDNEEYLAANKLYVQMAFFLLSILFFQLIVLNLGIAIMVLAYEKNRFNQKAQENDALFRLLMTVESFFIWNRWNNDEAK
jgi:hypothetical protein